MHCQDSPGCPSDGRSVRVRRAGQASCGGGEGAGPGGSGQGRPVHRRAPRQYAPQHAGRGAGSASEGVLAVRGRSTPLALPYSPRGRRGRVKAGEG